MAIDGQVCFHRWLFADPVKPSWCITGPVGPLGSTNQNRAGACDVTSVAVNRNMWQKLVAFVWKQAMNWSCSAIGYTNKDMKDTKDKRYKVLFNTGENRKEDCG